MNKNTEPFYDDFQLEMIENQNIEILIDAVVEYAITLRDNVASLREQVNDLTLKVNPKATIPFHEPYSDIGLTFEDYAAYPNFKTSLLKFIYK